MVNSRGEKGEPQVLCGVAIIAALAHARPGEGRVSGHGLRLRTAIRPPHRPLAFRPDSAYYASLYNGGFENGVLWAGTSAAAHVSSPGTSLYYLSGERRRPQLAPTSPRAARPTSGTVCFAARRLAPSSHGKAKRPRARRGLHVQVVVPSLLLGLLTVLDGGTASGNGFVGPVAADGTPALQRHGPAGHRGPSPSGSRPFGAGARRTRSTTPTWIPSSRPSRRPSGHRVADL